MTSDEEETDLIVSPEDAILAWFSGNNGSFGLFNLSDADESDNGGLGNLGPQRDPLTTVVPMTLVYAIILVTGVTGNIVTCIVIARNKYMHTATNYYLFSLAISDLLLLVLGLPQEIYLLWQKYPYVFGETFCIIRGLSSESSTNASILTITAFTVERYVAICHPLRAHTMSQLSRAIKTILVIWTVAALCAIPVALQFGIVLNVLCTVKDPLPHAFTISTFFFFVLPIGVISVLYIFIGLRLRKSSMAGEDRRSENGSRGGSTRHQSLAARRSVVKMLVAVVVSFFICWSPFHAQRLMATYVGPHPTEVVQLAFAVLTHISGVTYYLSSTINPILYQLMSRKFRMAFKDTFGLWCKCVQPNEKCPDITFTSVVNHNNSASSRHQHARKVSISFQQFPTGEPPRNSKKTVLTPQPTESCTLNSFTYKARSDSCIDTISTSTTAVLSERNQPEDMESKPS